LILVGGVWLYRQEVARLEGGSARKVLLRALEQEREELFEDLRDLEESYDQGEVSDRRYDVEAAELRERLALVLRRLAHEERQDAA
jgi:Tfp pilus assembly ATPase PilU